jgi:hypothetical protein
MQKLRDKEAQNAGSVSQPEARNFQTRPLSVLEPTAAARGTERQRMGGLERGFTQVEF